MRDTNHNKGNIANYGNATPVSELVEEWEISETHAVCLCLYINNSPQYPGLSLFKPNTVGRII